MRIYIPATSVILEQYVLDGRLEVDHAFAVTPSLREWYSGDDEELEYLATMAAARESLAMISTAMISTAMISTAMNSPGVLPRRVVIAAELTDLAPDQATSGHRARVEVGATLPMSAVAAALVDGPDAEADVLAASRALPRAGTDDDARFAVDQAQSHELLWFAAQELPFIF